MLIDSLESARVTVASGQKSGFQLVFSTAKGSPILTTLLPAGYFDPPVRVIITVAAVNGSPSVLMDGVVTRHELAPSGEPGQSKLTLTGEDLTRMMDLIDLTGFPFPAMPAEARIMLMVAKYAMYGIVPLVMPSVLLDFPNPLKEIPGQQGTDLAYINMLAEKVGYVFYIDPGPVPGMNVAYWGPEIKVGVPQPALTVDTDGASNVESLSFSFDTFAKTLWVVVIQEPTTRIPIPIPVPDVNPPSPRRVRPPLPIQTAPSAASRTSARCRLRDRAREGRPDRGRHHGLRDADVLRYGQVLKARQLVGVRGAGFAYDGLYVKSVTHSLKRGEYKQNFNLTRNAFMPFSQEVPA